MKNRIIKLLSVVKEVVIYLGIPILIMMAINANTQAIQQGKTTNQLIKGQNQILSSIKAVTKDTNLTAAQQTKIIICMLQVPVAQRTTDTETNCRTQANAAVSSVGIPVETPASSSDNNVVVSSPQSAPTTPTPQPIIPQQPAPKPDNDGIIISLPLLPHLHIPSPF